MQRSKQMSESVELGIILAAAGGFMDAYSYMCRDGVFANAQTGNMLLGGINLAEQNWSMAMRYLFPVLAFAIGVSVADVVRNKWKDISTLHWRQISVLVEAVILIAVAFIPQEENLIANSLTSLACAIQVESFRKIHGNGYATTMCIGNLRSAMQNMFNYVQQKERTYLERGILYFSVIVCFVLGAVLGNMFVKRLGEKAILVCSGILLIVFIMMFVDRENLKKGKTDW